MGLLCNLIRGVLRRQRPVDKSNRLHAIMISLSVSTRRVAGRSLKLLPVCSIGGDKT